MAVKLDTAGQTDISHGIDKMIHDIVVSWIHCYS